MKCIKYMLLLDTLVLFKKVGLSFAVYSALVNGGSGVDIVGSPLLGDISSDQLIPTDARPPLALLLISDLIHTPASIAFHLFQPVSPGLKETLNRYEKISQV